MSMRPRGDWTWARVRRAAASTDGWKRTRRGEWRGPCRCGGERDRAYVRRGSRVAVLAGCNAGCSGPDVLRWLIPGPVRTRGRPYKRRGRPPRPRRPRRGRKPARGPENGLQAGSPDFAALAEALEAPGPLHVEARRWIEGRGLDPERLHVAGWRSMSGPDALRLAREHSCALPREAARARLLALIPVSDGDGRPLSVRVRPLDPHGPALTLPGDTARVYGAESLQAPGETVHVAEGEPDRESLIEAGALCAIGLPGAGACHGWLADTLPGIEPRRVAVWFDGDEPGRKAGKRLAAKLTAAGLNVRRWEYRAGQDCNDHWRADPDGFRRAVATMEANE